MYNDSNNNEKLKSILLVCFCIIIALLFILFFSVVTLRDSIVLIKEKQAEQTQQIEQIIKTYTQIKQINQP